MIDLSAADTRVFLFHSADVKSDPSGAMDAVNQWLSKDRATGPYANLRVRDINVTADGSGGVYTMVVCSLGRSLVTETPVGAASTPPAETVTETVTASSPL